MKTFKARFIIVAIVMLVTIVTMMTSVKATNDKIKVIRKDGEYIIYVSDYESTSFKFAFSTEKLTAEEANEQLTFINSCEDSNGEYVAYLDETMEAYTANTVYIYAKTMEGEAIITALQLDKEDVLLYEDMQTIENLTNIIKVDTKNITSTEEDVDGVSVTKSYGQIDITDDESYTYYYQIIKLDESTADDNAEALITMLQTLNTNYSSMNMYGKIVVATEIYNTYKSLIKSATWTKVSNMQIIQPLDTVNGDQYIVLLKKVSGEETIYDAQFLTSTREDSNKYVPETELKTYQTSLPVTYDSILLFVILIAIILLVVVVYIRIKLLEKKENENK